ncbi:DUF4190 domain-containing protein [Candidatus Poribacteria bacterium]|nr:DUF4190 domain-containing protein [Candidatus Poribacteria bacterium]
MKSQKSKSAIIDSVVIIDEAEAEATEKTITPDEILLEKELPPHLKPNSQCEISASRNPPKTHPQRQQFYTIQEIIDVHHRMSKKYRVRRRASIRAKVCLVLGLIGIFFFRVPVISTAAIILGFWELKAINKRLSPVSGRRWARIGLTLGFIGLGLMLVKVFFWLKLM